jgi:hypothetical protein
MSEPIELVARRTLSDGMYRRPFFIAISVALLVLAAAILLYNLKSSPSSGRAAIEMSSQRSSVDRITTKPTTPAATMASAAIRFEPANAGIDFQYFNSADPTTPGARMYEFTGGGVGVLDFDLDGRPDLYFPQGCRWPPEPSQTEYVDRLYRNVGNGFRDVTISARIVEPSFSQGVACGDFDDDGFQDVYVANIGGNRLFHNRGDGTFADVTDSSGFEAALAGSRERDGSSEGGWTTSVMIADLNGDALPDLFDVNYVTGRDVFDRICDHDGTPRVCSPTVFDAAPDRFWLNRGDGTFSDVTRLVGLEAGGGTGLGVVAADFDGSGRLSLFVANDARPNHFFRNVSEPGVALPRFEESAASMGLATDREGASQACMGIAAGDANGDGRLDLFVTNYADEPNALYEQQADGTFTEMSRESGLARPSIELLGFGTQFLDGDGDGRKDLIVTNGHVDDFRFKGYEYAMPTQVYRNLGGRFELLPAAAVGDYFTSMRRGRGLARLDWNGDGRDDFAVSHLDEPAALLTNTSPGSGGTIAFLLKGTSSARDAIGTVVEVTVAGERHVAQLTAGDGYEASNERVVTIGTGNADFVEEIAVRWSSGRIEKVADLPTRSRWVLIEGWERFLRLSN